MSKPSTAEIFDRLAEGGVHPTQTGQDKHLKG